jgi:PAS domain S-box-containing protein
MLTEERASFSRYGVAFAAVAVAMLVRLSLFPVLGERAPFILLFPAVVVGAWFGGLGPGLFSVGLSALAAWYFLFLPHYSFALFDTTAVIQLGVFAIVNLFIVLLAEDLHRTQRRAAASEARERESKERFAKAFETSPLALTITSLKTGRLLEVNETFVEITGYSREEAVGRTTLELGLWADPEDRAAELAMIVERGKLSNLEYRFRMRDGSEVLGLLTAVRLEIGGEPCALTVIQDITERKLAEKTLRESEKRLRRIVESNIIGMIVADFTGRIVEANDAFLNMVGYTRADLEQGRINFVSLTPPEYRALDEAAQAEMRRSGSHRPFEKEYFRKNGTRVPVYVGTTYLDEEEQLGIGFIVDLTERKWAEEELARSKQLFEQIAETTPDILYIYDIQEHRNVYANAHIAQVLGYSPDEVRAFGDGFLATILHPDDLPGAVEFSRGYDRLADGEVVEFEFRMRHKDGDYRWLRSRTVVFSRTADGRAKLVLGNARDVTEQRRAETALRESEAYFRGLADAMPQLVWTARADGAVEYYNSRIHEYGGIVANEDGTWDWRPIVHEDDLRRTQSAWQTAVQARAIYESEHRIKLANGSFRWHLSRAVPLKDETGRVIKWFGTATDIHDLRQTEQELRENDRRKDEFLAMLAHELRNPLAPIRNAIRVLRHIGPASPQVEQMRDMIERQTEHLTRLVDDLLDVSRITRGKVTLQRERLELMSIISRAVETSRPLIDAAHHRRSVSLPPETVRLEGDLTRLAQVISNLLNNAAKYTEEGGRIELSAQQAGHEVLIRVKDNGVGIPGDVLPHIFELFAQADRSLDRAQGGLGIGLTIVKSLVELHGGRVEAHSDGPGQGSEFIVRLPVFAEPPPEPKGPPALEGDAAPAHGCRILVVDDNVDSAQSMALLLELEGYEVRMAHDGPETLRLAREFRPRVVLLDIGLPGMNGYEVASVLRKAPGGEHLVLIALTGYGQEEDRQQSKAAGFDHHLTKPVDHDWLSSLIKTSVAA